MIRYMLFFVCLLLSQIGIAQKKYIVKVKEGRQADFAKEWNSYRKTSDHLKVISHDLNIYTINQSKEALTLLNKSKNIIRFSADAPVQMRSAPNDPFYPSQWSHDFINTERAWDVTTGGLFDDTHEIVIAVLDDGFDLTHEDLVDNIFVNTEEIPNNGKDDDNNGYIDDYRGLNIETGDDNHPIDQHGTAVSGIIGARGDNNTGMTGIMWDVKILPISDVTNKSEVIEAFQYLVDLRRAWNESNGERGAFIVASNYSAGIDNEFGSDPSNIAWCEMYDLLGSVGILSTGATANNSVDVDMVGDMPTTCSSNFLISVTNTDKVDDLAFNAAYGVEHIDLGAPGGTEAEFLPTLDRDNRYGEFNGTSSATPHVAGTIGLLYSMPVDPFIDFVYSNPEGAASYIKDAILSTVDSNPTLTDKTLTGGRLNVFNAIKRMSEDFEGTVEATEINDIFDFGGNIILTYKSKDLLPVTLLISDASGKILYREELPKVSNALLSHQVTLEEAASGIYFFTIYNDMHINTKSLYIAK